jgi:hypothetical protein
MPNVQTNDPNTMYYTFLSVGYAIVFLYVVAIPLFYCSNLHKAAVVGAYVDGNKLCVGQELWSVEFSHK